MLGRIDQEIQEIEVAIASLKTEIQSAYSEYSQAIAQAVRQELIVAAYQLCTHEYPQPFLAMSLSERQKLQQGIHELAKFAAEMIARCLAEYDWETPRNREGPEHAVAKELTELSHKANELFGVAGVLSLPIPEEDAKIKLHLAEIELASRVVMSHRNALRALLARWQQLLGELAEKHKAKAIAEAELAWRSTWQDIN